MPGGYIGRRLCYDERTAVWYTGKYGDDQQSIYCQAAASKSAAWRNTRLHDSRDNTYGSIFLHIFLTQQLFVLKQQKFCVIKSVPEGDISLFICLSLMIVSSCYLLTYHTKWHLNVTAVRCRWRAHLCPLWNVTFWWMTLKGRQSFLTPTVTLIQSGPKSETAR